MKRIKLVSWIAILALASLIALTGCDDILAEIQKGLGAANAAYGIVLSEAEAEAFDSSGTKTLLVVNSGTKATGTLKTELTGESREAFVLSKTELPSIEAGGTASFAVTPKTDLAPGSYTATVTVSGSNNIIASFGVGFTALPKPMASFAATVIQMKIDASQKDNASYEITALGASGETFSETISLNSTNSPDIVTIMGGDLLNGWVVTGGGTNSITVGAGLTLKLQNITFTNLPFIVEAGGKLILGDQSDPANSMVVQGNAGTGITVSGGTLEMNAGALVTNNRNGGSGGGVALTGADSKFTMTGGEISNNNAGGDGGGGVRMDGGTFTMSGGEISDNSTTADGGGVLLAGENTVFTLSGSGEISGNTAGGYGGGVRIAFGPGMQVLNQIFNMSGGIIKNNHAEQFGGGLCSGDVLSVFNMTGGEITGNTIPTYGGGGGVYNYFTQVSVDPQIGGDTAPADGRGWIHDNLKEDWKNF